MSEISTSGLHIVNTTDRPDENHLAERRADGKFYYVSPKLRDEKLYHGMTPTDPTPVEDFGIFIIISNARGIGILHRETAAKYTDGRPRKWQGSPRFFFDYTRHEERQS